MHYWIVNQGFAERISQTKYNSFPVVNEKGYLIGVPSFLDYITLGELTRKNILDANDRTVIK